MSEMEQIKLQKKKQTDENARTCSYCTNGWQSKQPTPILEQGRKNGNFNSLDISSASGAWPF